MKRKGPETIENAKKRREEDKVTHLNAKLSRCTSFAYSRVTGYIFIILGSFALSIAAIIIGILLLLEPETFNNGILLIVFGSTLLLFAIIFSIVFSIKKKNALYQIPILAKQLELLAYEVQHPDESSEDKLKRLTKAKAHYQRLLDHKAIRRKDYKKAIKALHLPEAPKAEEKPLDTKEKE